MKQKESLGIKTNTPIGVQWITILEAQENSIVNSKVNIEIAEIVREYAKKRIEEEKQKL